MEVLVRDCCPQAPSETDLSGAVQQGVENGEKEVYEPVAGPVSPARKAVLSVEIYAYKLK